MREETSKTRGGLLVHGELSCEKLDMALDAEMNDIYGAWLILGFHSSVSFSKKIARNAQEYLLVSIS